jgi:acyl-homoserine-lactone acylase
MSLRRLIAGFFLVLFTGIAALAVYALWPERAQVDPAWLAAAERYDVRIRRDGFGVPYIHGRTDADVGYGLAFAHSEDDFQTIQEVLLATRGQLASVQGFDAAPMDYIVNLMGFWDTVNARYTELTPAARALVEAYADGVNLYGALHPEEILPGALPVNGQDLVAGFSFKTPLFYGLQRPVLELFEEDRQRELSLGPGGEAFHLVDEVQPPLGSNAVAVAPSRSTDGATRLLVNSHQPYAGPVSWYEVRLESDEGWDMIGGVFPGSPLILHGTGRNLGWASTVNSPDLSDIYVLEVNPENEDQYRLDGAWADFEKSEAEITVQLFGRLRWTVRREVLRSAHGPVIRRPHGTYAIRYVGMGEIRQLDQYYAMNRATTFEQWKDAMRMQALPSINYVYADREGNIAYVYNAKLPKRAPGWDWKSYLPGDRSELIWDEFVAWDDMPMLINPPSGFVASSNHTPFRATLPEGVLRREDFPAEGGIEKRMTNRGLRALEMFGGDEAISREEFFAYKYDKRYSEQSRAREIRDEVLAADWDDDPSVQEALSVLARWDLTAEADDTSAALGIMTATPIVVAEMREQPVPDAADSFREAIDVLLRHHGRLDPPWGDVNRMRRGTIDVPAGGGPDTFRAIEAFVLDEDGTYTAKTGDSYVMFVEWAADGTQTVDTIHQFGSATLDAASPHYADQLPIFLEERTKRIPLEEAELAPQVVREYRPGE